MNRMWVNKAGSFEEAEAFDTAYYKKMSAKERIETVQLLREHYFKLNRLDFNENRKRLRRVCRIIKQT